MIVGEGKVYSGAEVPEGVVIEDAKSIESIGMRKRQAKSEEQKTDMLTSLPFLSVPSVAVLHFSFVDSSSDATRWFGQVFQENGDREGV